MIRKMLLWTLMALAVAMPQVAEAQNVAGGAYTKAQQAATSIAAVRASLTGASVAPDTFDRSFTTIAGSQLLVSTHPDRVALNVCNNGSTTIALSVAPKVLTSVADPGAIPILAGACYPFANPPKNDIFVYATGAVPLGVQEGLQSLPDGLYSKRTLGASARLGMATNTQSGILSRTDRSRYYARADGDIYDISLAIPGWLHGTSGSVTAIPNNLTVSASIEYPKGIFSVITFGGNTTTTLTPGVNLISDATGVRIKAGAEFWVRLCYTVASNTLLMPYSSPNGLQSGFDSSTPSASATADFTQTDQSSGFAADGVNGGSSFIAPAAIIATTNAPNPVSTLILGDSITYGQGETSFSAAGAIGWPARTLDNIGVTYMKIGRPGTDAATIFANPYLADFVSKLRYSHILTQVGTNDLTNGTPVSTVVTNYGKLVGLARGKKLVFATILPRTNSTDSWATSGNQTQQTNMANAVTLNQRIRAFGYGYVDAATAVSPSLDANVWTGASPQLVADGTHPSTTGAIKIANDNTVLAQARAALAQ